MHVRRSPTLPYLSSSRVVVGHWLGSSPSSSTRVLTPVPTALGMRLPVLRETRMPAVICTIGPVRAVVDSTERIAEAVVERLTTWAAEMGDCSHVGRREIGRPEPWCPDLDHLYADSS